MLERFVDLNPGIWCVARLSEFFDGAQERINKVAALQMGGTPLVICEVELVEGGSCDVDFGCEF